MPKRLTIDKDHPTNSVHTNIRLPIGVRMKLQRMADAQYRTLSSMGALLIEQGLKRQPGNPDKGVRSLRPSVEKPSRDNSSLADAAE